MIHWIKIDPNNLPTDEVIATDGDIVKCGQLAIWGTTVSVWWTWRSKQCHLFGMTHYSEINLPTNAGVD